MKKTLALLLALVMTLALVACGGNDDKPADNSNTQTDANTPAPSTPDPAPEAPAGEKIDISVIASQYGQNTNKWWADFQEAFNKEHENINLTVEVVSWNDIYTVVNTRISGNTAPDILNIDVFADYQADGLLLPAKDYVSEETYAKMYPAFLEQSNIDGTIWAIPDLASARAMYYNKDILDAAGVEVPTTWDELKAACEKLKAYDSSIYPWGIDMTTDEGQAAFAYYIWNNGGDFTDADGNWTLNSDANVEAIEYAIDLVNSGLTNSDPANETRYNLQDLFGAGKLAMVIGPNSIPTYIADNYAKANTPEADQINYAFAAIPTNETLEILSMNDISILHDPTYNNGDRVKLSEHYDMFSHFPNLTELHLESTGIDSIEFVAGLPKLQYLNITDNNVTSLKPLESLADFQAVWCGRNTILEKLPEDSSISVYSEN